MNSSTPTKPTGIDRLPRWRSGDVIIITIVLVVAVIFFGYVWPFFREIRYYKGIEQRAQRTITAVELQTWAINLLAEQPLGQYDYRVADLGTNFPKQLTKLWKDPPRVIIYNSGPAQMNWVRLSWGGGGLGDCGFEIGATNSMLYTRSHKTLHEWSDGVYFYRNP